MQIKQILLTGILCAVTFISLAQSKPGTATLLGKVVNEAGEPLQSASVSLENSTYGATTNNQGFYQITNIKPNSYKITVSLIGYSSSNKTLQLRTGQQTANFTLNNAVGELQTVSVIGRTTNQEVNHQAYNVTSIDAKKLYNTTLDLSHALDKVSGVRVREAGGVGSRTELSLNGFTGNQVKFFLDGVPMDNFGSSFQINNIPINLAERVEVYKGVVPIWLGGDALGGAVNIVTSNSQRTYIDASYSYGSFNTHRSTINAGYTAKSGFTVQLNAFQNYSDNNYWVNVDVANLNTGAYFPNQRVKRFHDNYHNETIIANVGVVGKKYADKLLFGITLGRNKADIQTGARMVSVYGNWYRTGDIIMPSVRYQKKDLLVKGLSLTATGNFNFGHEKNIDTVNRRYNWFGEYKEYAGNGAERSRSLYRSQNNNGLATANLTYELNEQHSFIFNDTYNTFNRTGSDELYPQSERYQQPSRTNKNVLGLGYRFQYNEKWNTSLFLKSFNQNTTYSRSYNPSTTSNEIAYLEQKANNNKLGYGLASTYYLLSNLQFKVSYEKSYRMPSADELFGDQVNVTGNLSLRPETSNNYNVGLSFQKGFNNHVISFDGGFIYRNAKDFIRPLLSSNQITQTNGNLASVTNAGVDGEIRYSYKKFFTAGVNLTYQNLRNNQRFEDGQTVESPLYRDRIPNMPFMYGNANAAIFLSDFGKKGNALSFGYNLLYVHAYYLSWPSQGSEKLDIPQQFAHDANTTYTLANGKYNLSLECKNLFDNRLYDNFTLQKPSRGFFFKVRYFFSKQNN
jgi:outer membrane receptor protein involved in Fe transport